MVRKLGIHNRLALVLLGAALLAFVAAGAGLVLYQRFTLEDRTRQIMEPYAQLVSVGTDAAVAFEDPQRATEILDTLRVNPQILQAVFIWTTSARWPASPARPRPRPGSCRTSPTACTSVTIRQTCCKPCPTARGCTSGWA